MKLQTWILAVLLSCSGCAMLPPPTARDLVGEWRFTYVQKANTAFGINPAPPTFDVIEFEKDGGIRLADSLMRREFVGKYAVADGVLQYEFSPPDREHPVVHRLECLWTEQGRALSLAEESPGADTEPEWVYYKKHRLLDPEKLRGTWTASMNGETGDMTFAEDGTYWMQGKDIRGYYRLWPSRYGDALTTAIWLPGEGAFMLLYICEADSGALALTPLSWNGPEHEHAIAWSRQSKEHPPSE